MTSRRHSWFVRTLMRMFRIYEVAISDEEGRVVSVYAPSRRLAYRIHEALVADVKKDPDGCACAPIGAIPVSEWNGLAQDGDVHMSCKHGNAFVMRRPK